MNGKGVEFLVISPSLLPLSIMEGDENKNKKRSSKHRSG